MSTVKGTKLFHIMLKITLCSEYYHIRKGDVFEPLINCKDHIWSSRDEHVKNGLLGQTCCCCNLGGLGE